MRPVFLARVACLPVLAAVALVANAPSGAAVPTMPSIYVDYIAPGCTFTLTVDGGTSVTSSVAPGPTLPPGTYALAVTMLNPANGYPCGRPTFSLNGPGVSSVVEFRGEELHFEGVVTLQPGGTYVAEEASAPAATRRVFTAASSGSNSGLAGAGTTPSPARPGLVQTDPIGSAIPRHRGRLAGTVRPNGSATLRRGGHDVSTLRAGTYDVVVADATSRAGLFVQRGRRKAVTVSGIVRVGTSTKRVALRAGTWTYFSGRGRHRSFTVVA